MRRHIGESRAGGGGRQTLRVDIVLYCDRHAQQRELRGVFFGVRFRFRLRVLFIAERDEDGGVVMVADALKAARHGLRGGGGAGAVRGDNRCYGLGHWLPLQRGNSIRIEASDVPLCTLPRQAAIS